jgi:hypothetical protein
VHQLVNKDFDSMKIHGTTVGGGQHKCIYWSYCVDWFTLSEYVVLIDFALQEWYVVILCESVYFHFIQHDKHNNTPIWRQTNFINTPRVKKRYTELCILSYLYLFTSATTAVVRSVT